MCCELRAEAKACSNPALANFFFRTEPRIFWTLVRSRFVGQGTDSRISEGYWKNTR